MSNCLDHITDEELKTRIKEAALVLMRHSAKTGERMPNKEAMIRAAESVLADYESELKQIQDEVLVQYQAKEDRRKTEKPKAPKQKPAEAFGSKNVMFTKEEADKARERLRAKLGQLNVGIDPEMMQDGIYLSGYHIEMGARTFAAYSKATHL